MFTYTAYTLTVYSDLELPELPPGRAPAGNDAVIVEVAETPQEPGGEDRYTVQPDRFCLYLAGVASYEVQSGRKVRITLAAGADLREVRLFLLGTCLGMLLVQRGILAFHASSVRTPQGAMLFTGPSGIGKSTLLHTLTRLGYPMLADDVTGIRIVAGCALALPSFPRSKLRDDSALTLGLEPAPEDAKVALLDKTQFDLKTSFHAESVAVARIYRLNVAEDADIRIVLTNPLGALTVVVENTYRAEFLHEPLLRADHFRLATALAGNVPVFDVFRPASPFEPERLAQALARHFGA